MTRAQTLPIDWLACPVTKSPLERDGVDLVAAVGHRRYRWADTHWDLMPRDEPALAGGAWAVWEQLQRNGVVSYQQDPEHNLGVGKRADFLAFAAFCRFRGVVLDVGVGPQRCPTHIEHAAPADVTFVGIDPLAGEQPRCFSFVRGLGEYLPFREGVFDQVLFVTSLDHFIDPRPALVEGRRVLGSGGEVCVWIGEKAPGAPPPAVRHAWYDALPQPAGATDRFHYKRFNAAQFEQMAGDCALAIVEKTALEVDPWRTNLFYRLARRGQTAR